MVKDHGAKRMWQIGPVMLFAWGVMTGCSPGAFAFGSARPTLPPAPASPAVPVTTLPNPQNPPTPGTGGISSSRCATVPEQIRLNNQGTLYFPRSGFFTVEGHYLTAQDPRSVQADTMDIGNHLASSCGLLGTLGVPVSADCHEVYLPDFSDWTPAEGGGGIGMGARPDYRPAQVEEMFQGNLDYAPGQLPAPGTRYLITNPHNGRSIVASFGYEIGPGSSKWLGGLTPEAHFYLDQYANDSEPLAIGRASDQALSFGPIQCDP